jgi:hypothetical protein
MRRRTEDARDDEFRARKAVSRGAVARSGTKPPGENIAGDTKTPYLLDIGTGMGDEEASRTYLLASTTLNDIEWDGTEVIKSDVAKEVAKLKEQPGRDILVVGSSGLTQTLMQHDLVDEYRLWLHSVVLGGGKRLFREGAPTTTLRLMDAKTTSSGLVILTYEPDRNDPK